MSQEHQLTSEDGRDAHDQIRGVAHRTTIHTSTTSNELSGAQVYLNAENFKRIGAFKFCGACNTICGSAGVSFAPVC